MKSEPTTERIIAENQLSNRESYLLYLIHLATYKYALSFVDGKNVLDYGCGSGYGTALISDYCTKVTGVDISSEAVRYARSHYNAPNLSYLQIEPAEIALLPFPDSSFDVVLSFQVIEHVQNVSVYLQELNRVLAPGGQIIIATPDRSTRLFPFQKPWNIWHLREYTMDELYATLSTCFSDVNVLQTGGSPDILRIELKRVKRLKWLTLPFTLPFIPDAIRKACLIFIKNLRYSLFLNSRNAYEPSFDDTAISISSQEECSVDLVAVASKKTVA